MKQLTLAKTVKGVDIGLHKGEPIEITLEPLETSSGIIFFRSDLNATYKASPENVINTQMAVVLSDERGSISTIEHLMSIINAYGIDNVRITLNTNEAPIMDGSDVSFCMILDEAGIREPDAPKKIMVIKKPIKVRDGDKYMRLTPTKGPRINYTIKFDSAVIGEQSYNSEFSKKNYIENIARARTFGFLKDVQALRNMNLALDGSLENTIVVDENHILSPEGLCFEDELIRHKILDTTGDSTLLGYRVFGNYISYAGSHHLNHLLTKEVLKDKDAYEIVTLGKANEKAYEKVFT